MLAFFYNHEVASAAAGDARASGRKAPVVCSLPGPASVAIIQHTFWEIYGYRGREQTGPVLKTVNG